MITQSPQINAKLVDISKITEDYTNPLVKAFKSKGQVFGFTAPFIVADELSLTLTNIDNMDMLVDMEGLTYKVMTTRDIAPAFTKGYGRNRQGIDIKSKLVNSCDRICILEQPKDGKSVMTIFRTTSIILDDKGHIV